MNAINCDIVRSLFVPLFLGGTLAAAALAVMAILRWGEPGAMVMLAGGVLYAVGMFVVTMVFNVPLNDALAAADPSSPEAASRPDGHPPSVVAHALLNRPAAKSAGSIQNCTTPMSQNLNSLSTAMSVSIWSNRIRPSECARPAVP